MGWNPRGGNAEGLPKMTLAFELMYSPHLDLCLIYSSGENFFGDSGTIFIKLSNWVSEVWVIEVVL